MRLLRLAIETQRWELAAQALILGAIKAKQKEGQLGKQEKKRGQVHKRG